MLFPKMVHQDRTAKLQCEAFLEIPMDAQKHSASVVLEGFGE